MNEKWAMKLIPAGKVLLFGWLAFQCLQAIGVAGQTNQSNRAVSPRKITTSFIDEARLTASEVKQVLEIAKAYGIDTPSEVRTFHYLPSITKGISVKSVDRVDGRNTSFDTITISKVDWEEREPDKPSKRIGDFWAGSEAKYSTLLRRYEFKKAVIQISIGKGVDVAFADKVIPLIDAKKVRFESDWIRQEFEELKDSKPVSISKSSSEKGYELFFNEPSMRAIMFDVKDGRVVVTGIAHIHI